VYINLGLSLKVFVLVGQISSKVPNNFLGCFRKWTRLFIGSLLDPISRSKHLFAQVLRCYGLCVAIIFHFLLSLLHSHLNHCITYQVIISPLLNLNHSLKRGFFYYKLGLALTYTRFLPANIRRKGILRHYHRVSSVHNAPDLILNSSHFLIEWHFLPSHICLCFC